MEKRIETRTPTIQQTKLPRFMNMKAVLQNIGLALEWMITLDVDG